MRRRYQLEITREALYILNITASSEDEADKIAKRLIKHGEVEPEDDNIETTDIRDII